MKHIYAVHDIKQLYSEFLENRAYPKLERLSNWGKNRFFFHRYFNLVEDLHHTEQIVIEFNRRVYSLDTGDAPDFMDKDRYLEWLTAKLVN